MKRFNQHFPQRTWHLAFTFLLIVFASTAAHADELVVIVNPNVELSADDIRDVFLGEKLVAGSIKLSPVDNLALQTQFLAKVMNMDSAKYQSVWTKKGFRDGLSARASKASDTDVISYVKKVPGAVGYVSAASASTAGAKIIKKYCLRSRHARSVYKKTDRYGARCI